MAQKSENYNKNIIYVKSFDFSQMRNFAKKMRKSGVQNKFYLK